jgi:hypothetical protein
MIKKILQIILQIIFLSGVSCNFERDRSINAGNRHDFLQVPSPEWEDQILYFIVTDRFMDGDSTNNDQGAGGIKKEMEVIGMEGILKASLKKSIISRNSV